MAFAILIGMLIIYPLLGLMGLERIGTVNYDGLIPVLVMCVFFSLGAIMLLTLFPEFEVREDHFRLTTLLNKSRWYSRNEIYRLSSQERIGTMGLVSIEIPDLPANFQMVRLIYGFRHSGAFIHHDILDYDSLMDYLHG
jgi:hypothetical protein